MKESGEKVSKANLMKDKELVSPQACLYLTQPSYSTADTQPPETYPQS